MNQGVPYDVALAKVHSLVDTVKYHAISALPLEFRKCSNPEVAMLRADPAYGWPNLLLLVQDACAHQCSTSSFVDMRLSDLAGTKTGVEMAMSLCDLALSCVSDSEIHKF